SVPVRIKKNEMSQKFIQLEKEGATKEELEKLTLGSLRRAVFDGDLSTGSLMMGQIAGMVSTIKPLEVIFADIMHDSQKQIILLNTKLKDLYE
ncbi:MAG: enoyl-[acyl-carrier-protein] reductase FabK, partial [Erysipelotrichaceae bacterium]